MLSIMPLELITEAEARTLLHPHLPALRACFENAWEDWRELEPALVRKAPQYRTTSRANVMYDLLSARLVDEFADEPGVTFNTNAGFLALTFGGRLVVRFKKFRSKSLKVSQIMTLQQRRLARQELDLEMNATTVIAGYLLDTLGANLKKLAVVCPLNGENVWEIALDDAAGGLAELVTLPIPDSGGPKKPGVRSRRPQTKPQAEKE
ncbi:hypothetical protein [Streptomyces formicae]|uniref:Uncharacterized protein n=1 Tax=Streptomyces formicae TaxID=1616117 RepID=A0ABY3WU01_9ACTN|nr:hypothetical protein [Streptomyces formicae]UNM16128.1 hypothetical protein J4032_35890 [Streptomyces formicae]